MTRPRGESFAPVLPPRGAHDLLGFLAFSHGWTWLFWAIAGLGSESVWEWPQVAFFYLGGVGVPLGGLVMARRTYGREGLGELGRRIVDPGRIPGRWWGVVLLLFPTLTVAAAGLATAAGTSSAPLDLAGAAERVLQPGRFLAFVGFILVVGPLPEEIGWRGYFLDRLQLRWSALVASLVVAAVWWAWHLPLFVLPGYYDAFGRAAPTPWDQLQGIVPAAVLYTWVYNNTDRSVLAVILLHFMQNFTAEFLGMAEEVRPIRTVLEVGLAAGVVLWWGPRSLRRSRPAPLLAEVVGAGKESAEQLRAVAEDATFEPGVTGGLPPPARRFLLWAMEPGTPLARSVELEMRGTILLDPARDPLPMTAVQVLAPPEGFIWRARVGSGLLRISGFDRYVDGRGELRWHLWGLIPVMRASGEDVTRSAAGRLAMEAVLVPSSLVPGRGARWEEGDDDDTAVFHLAVGHETVVTRLTVDAGGRPVRASALRWREATGDAAAGYARFDAEFEGELRSGGYRIPRRVQAGWRLGEADELRFFDAVLERATFR